MIIELKALIFATSSVAIYGWILSMMTPERKSRTVKVLHHLSEMGRREIARSPSACLRNLVAAGGAGLITAGTAALKVIHLPGSLEWFAVGGLRALNFVVSFLLMQAVGFRLATKQSPLLGAALGSRWRELKAGFDRVTSIREESRWIIRTQALSAIGNLLLVIPSALLFHWIFSATFGKPFLDPVSAKAALSSLHPWKTGTLAYAALTGGLLWLCTLCGGVVANRFRPFSKDVATAFFNICLGFFLAFVPMIGKSLTLPIDVRHFALSGGTAALALGSLGIKEAIHSGLLAALVGVLAIGVLNFTVSFALAFLSSLTSRSPIQAGRSV